MRLIAYDVAVGTTPTQLFSWYPMELHSVAFKAVAAVEIGSTSLEIGQGFPLSAGEAIGFNWRDFDPSDVDYHRLQYIHAVAAAPTEVRIYGWMKV